MPRKARRRVLYDNCFAHVFSRSIEKKYIFARDDEFELFFRLLLEAKNRFTFKVFHYCLMHTHFHLVVGVKQLSDFSAGFKWIKWHYTQSYNRERKRRGTVWQGRFNGLVIEDENYLRSCGHYVENNPVEAGIVQRATDWDYSSSKHYELRAPDALVDHYEWGGRLPLIQSDTKEFFEEGEGIGSKLFQFYLKEELANRL